MKYILIHGGRRVYVKDEVYSTIENINRSERRKAKKRNEFEVLIGDENEFYKRTDKKEKGLDEIVEHREILTQVMTIIETELTTEEKYIIKAIYLNNRSRSDVAKKNGLDLQTAYISYECSIK